jgi:4-amino-4-deoxy-L-arabinose transferase-like glycosyltransferase
MAVEIPWKQAHAAERGSPLAWIALKPRLSAPAWTAIGITASFIALTCWWLTQDRSIPIFDAGDHLEVALQFHAMLSSGDLLGPLRFTWQYPPLGELIGALSAFVGGVNVASPIIGENVVFVSLLSLGCYQTGRLLFDARGGMLACVFALGSPLLISMFHVFMLDAPETALVAVSLWLILASERFARTNIAALAGLACGVGLLIKVQFPFYVVGVVLMALLAGGWRNRRGVLAFAAITLVVGAPWYIAHGSELQTILSFAGVTPEAQAGNVPPTWSLSGLSWYFWSILNSQLLAFLFAFLLVGAIWMVVIQLLPRRSASRPPSLCFDAQRQLLCGTLVAWLSITLTRHHDVRYALPLLPYLAVIATGWMSRLGRTPQLAAGGALVLVAFANTLAITFGVGPTAVIALAERPPANEAQPERIVVLSTGGFLAGAPSADGDVPGLLRGLRRGGVRRVLLRTSEGEQPDFSFEGVIPLDTVAHLASQVEVVESSTSRAPTIDSSAITASTVALIHRAVAAGQPPPCTRLSDGTGVWVARRAQASGRLQLYCPARHPAYYGAVSSIGQPLYR